MCSPDEKALEDTRSPQKILYLILISLNFNKQFQKLTYYEDMLLCFLCFYTEMFTLNAKKDIHGC